MSARAVLALTLCSASAAAFAHDFWVQPNEYWIATQAFTSVTLQVGHGPARQRSQIRVNRITRFDAVAPNGATIDLRGNLHLGEDQDDGNLGFTAPGAYVLILQTDSAAQSHLPALQYNAYLEEEGLIPVLDERKRTHRMDVEGSENYSRAAKSLVLVGPANKSKQARFTRPVGLPLEIVPERSPYADTHTKDLPVFVIYKGERLSGATVKLTNLEHDAKPTEVHITDTRGRATFAMPREGTWLLNVVWTQPLPKGSETDYETVFSSLSFGFPAR